MGLGHYRLYNFLLHCNFCIAFFFLLLVSHVTFYLLLFKSVKFIYKCLVIATVCIMVCLLGLWNAFAHLAARCFMKKGQNEDLHSFCCVGML